MPFFRLRFPAVTVYIRHNPVQHDKYPHKKELRLARDTYSTSPARVAIKYQKGVVPLAGCIDSEAISFDPSSLKSYPYAECLFQLCGRLHVAGNRVLEIAQRR